MSNGIEKPMMSVDEINLLLDSGSLSPEDEALVTEQLTLHERMQGGGFSMGDVPAAVGKTVMKGLNILAGGVGGTQTQLASGKVPPMGTGGGVGMGSGFIPPEPKEKAKGLTQEEWLGVLKGKPLPSSEELKRMGFDPDWLGELLYSMGKDPLTYGGGAVVKAIPKIGKMAGIKKIPYAEEAAEAVGSLAGKVMQPFERAAKSTGKTMYGWGLGEVGELAELAGTRDPVKILMKEGISGTNKQILRKTLKKMKQYAKPRNKILTESGKKGGTVDAKMAMSKARKSAEKNAALPGDLGEPGRIMLKQIEAIEELGRISPKQATNIKSALYAKMKDSAYDQATQTAPGARIEQFMARGLKSGTERAVGKTHGVKKRKILTDLNEKYGALKGSKKVLRKETLKESRRGFPITEVDAPLYVAAPALGVAKTAAKVGKRAWFQTPAGKWAYRGGKLLGPAVDPAARRSLLEWNLEGE